MREAPPISLARRALRWDVSHARRTLREAETAVILEAQMLESARRRPRTGLLRWIAQRLAERADQATLGSMSDEEKRARGAQPGNANAAKDDGLDATQTFRCKSTELATWRAKARKAGVKLPVWVRMQCNAASGHEPP